MSHVNGSVKGISEQIARFDAEDREFLYGPEQKLDDIVRIVRKGKRDKNAFDSIVSQYGIYVPDRAADVIIADTVKMVQDLAKSIE